MQQYVSNGTVGSELARANMKPANPRARPRNLETVTAARGSLWPACSLACLTRLCFWFLLSCGSARAIEWDSPLLRD